MPQSLASVALPSSSASPPFTIMREALHHALHLHFTEALQVAAQLEEQHQPTLASRLTAGIIAYFQTRWQTPQTSSPRHTGHQLLQEMLAAEQKPRPTATKDPQRQLLLGLAAVFDALLQPPDRSWSKLSLFVQGRSWLQQALVADETLSDAHLGLGLLYFARAELPSLLRWLWKTQEGQSAEEAISHLQRAAEKGQFSQEVARTFLARLYAQEKRYKEAIALGQALQMTFPHNGYYTLLTGRGQCTDNQFALCAATLGKLAACLTHTPAMLARGDARFDLYYFWGLALNETGQYDQAFQAFRQSINADPRTLRDESLWAKYHLATLYERNGQTATARQIYRKLLGERNVADLHQQVERRLARLQ
jgi:tetratricopeptide (TPR) repeat protein